MPNWWDRVTRAVGRSKDVVITPSDPEGRSKKATLTSPEWVSAPMMGSPRHINFLELEEYEEDVTVQSAINYIIDSIATSEWDIVPDEDMIEEGEEVDNSEAVKFFQSGSWDESFSTVLRGVIADVLLYDSGVVVLTFPEFCYDENKTLIKKGVAPLSLRARDGRSFIKQVDMYGDIMKYWQYSFLHTATKPVEFDQEEIIYMQERPSTRSPYGTSKLEVIKNVADLMMAVQVGHRSEQENALQIGGVISHADVTDPEKLRRLSAMYNSTLKGEINKKRWLTTGGNVDVKPINASVADDSWIPGSEFYQQQILAIFKVPKTVLGITSSDTNRATAFAQSANFKRFGVATMMTLIDGIFTREIVKKYFNEKLIFRFVREVDLTDEAIRADIDAKNVATGVRTINELRTRDGLDEIEEPESEEESILPEYYESEETAEETAEEIAEKSAEYKNRILLLDSCDFKVEERGLVWCVIYCSGPNKDRPIKCFPTEQEAIDMRTSIMGEMSGCKTSEDIKKSGGTDRIWIKPTSNRKGHWRKVKPGKGDDKGDAIKAKIGMFQDLGDALKKEIKSLIDKFSIGGITPEGEIKIEAIKNKMNNAYANRNAAIKAWEKHTGKKYSEGRKSLPKGDKKKSTPADKKDRKPQSAEAKARADESRRLKGEIDKFQSEGDAAKAQMNAAIDKYTTPAGEITTANQKKVDELESKMKDAYKDRDATKKELKDVESSTVSSNDGKMKEGKNTFKGMSHKDVIDKLSKNGWDLNKTVLITKDSPLSGCVAMVENDKVYGMYHRGIHGNELELNLLEVNPDLKRQGYGKKIIGDVIQEALDSGCDTITLESMDKSSDKFYDAIGMEIISITKTGGNEYRGDKKWMEEYIKLI